MQLAKQTVQTLESLNNKDSFDLFWPKVLKDAESMDISSQISQEKERSLKKLRTISKLELLIQHSHCINTTKSSIWKLYLK